MKIISTARNYWFRAAFVLTTTGTHYAVHLLPVTNDGSHTEE